MTDQRLPPEVVALLQNSGVSLREIQAATLETRVHHDLGLYGDTAWWFVEELENLIDMSKFDFDLYFPPEFLGKGLISGFVMSFVPFAHWLHRKNKHYKPLSLKRVAKCMKQGFWSEDDTQAINETGSNE